MRIHREGPSSIQLGEVRIATAQLAWVVSAIALSFLILALLLVLRNRPQPVPDASSIHWQGQMIWIVGAAGAPILGGLIAARHPGNRYGWLWCGFGLSLATLLTAQSYIAYSAMVPGTLPLQGMSVAIGGIAWFVLVSHIPFLLLMFPDGELPSSRWRFVAWAVMAACVLCVMLVPFVPGNSGIAPVQNPLALEGLTGEVARAVSVSGVFVILGATVLAVVSLIYRFRRTESVQRQQIKWVTYAGVMLGLSAVFTGVLGWELPGIWEAAFAVATLGALYLAIYIAILKHGLYDIDLLINRTLVYGVLTSGVIATYVLIVGYLGSHLQANQSLPISLLATGLIAVLFQPLRERVQHGVNRLLYGHRDDPYEVVTTLGKRLEAALTPGDILPAIAQSVHEALKLSYVAIATRQTDSFNVVAEIGTPVGVPLNLPLNYGNEQVGELRVMSRERGESFSVIERRLLDDLARQIGVAVHADQVTVDLKRSREQLVVAQEEERRRIQRDLHDGLGPILASMRLRLEGCMELAQAEKSAMIADLERLHELLGQASGDIRRLVHDLRPPVLDQLGLVPALRQHIERFGRETEMATEFQSREVAAYPAAVEVAVFRIVQEALVNIRKHAHASRATIRLYRDRAWLSLEICDDGIGLPGREAMTMGTGLVSMRERAEMLGGRVQVLSSPGGGTQVIVRFPHEDEICDDPLSI